MQMTIGARYLIMTATHYFDGILIYEDDDSYMIDGTKQVLSIGDMKNLEKRSWDSSEDYPKRPKGCGAQLFRPQIAKGGIIDIIETEEFKSKERTAE